MPKLQEHQLTSGKIPIKRQLGKILVESGFLSPSDLEAAIEQQKISNDRLGEILVRMGVLDPIELKAVLAIQKDLASLQDAVKIGAGVHLLLGEILLKAKRLTQEQVEIALKEQLRTGEKLGEILVCQGKLTENELKVALSFQRHQRGESPGREKLRLGELLVVTGQITRDQLEDVLGRQKLSKKKIGELLIEAGYVQPHQIDHGLKLQQKLVIAALIAALSMSNMLLETDAVASDTTSSGSIAVSARVLEHTSMNTLYQAHELIITNADIHRGYVDASAATKLSVKSNNLAGYLLAFEIMGVPDPLCEYVEVLVGGRQVQVPATGGWVPQPYVRGGAIVDISYRFTLAKNVQPGTYEWPLMVSALSK